MSLLRSTSKVNDTAEHACNDCTPSRTLATFRLMVEPANSDVRDRARHDSSVQLENAARIQNMFIPTLAEVAAREHGDGYHVHPEQPTSVAHIAQMHDMMEPHALVARVSFSPGCDKPAVTAAFTADHANELATNGIVDVRVPLEQGTFRFHSTREGRVTAVEYVPM